MAFLPLQDGRTYLDGHAGKHTIMGPVEGHPEWCWSRQAGWFERATGKAILIDFVPGTYRYSMVDWHNIWREAE